MVTAPLQFAVDRMLGRLAVWLRLLGYDATCAPQRTGRALARHARHEGRVILTRDRRLLRELNLPPTLFIDSNDFRAQLRQVISTYTLQPLPRIFTRCSRCNEAVVAIDKEQVRDQVPTYVFSTQDHFVHCPRCRRIYWPATHAERVREELQRLGLNAA